MESLDAKYVKKLPSMTDAASDIVKSNDEKKENETTGTQDSEKKSLMGISLIM